MMVGAKVKRREGPFSPEQLEAIAKALGHTEEGLSGTEIAHTLAKCEMQDIGPDLTKWKRLYNALAHEQQKRQYGNHVVGFIHHSMKPVRWSGRHEAFEKLAVRLNAALAFCGLELQPNGSLRRIEPVATLTEARKRADRLRSSLADRGVHPDVLEFCRSELLEENYFHAVLEASKSVASKIRRKTGLTSDGAALAKEAFEPRKVGNSDARDQPAFQ